MPSPYILLADVFPKRAGKCPLGMPQEQGQGHCPLHSPQETPGAASPHLSPSSPPHVHIKTRSARPASCQRAWGGAQGSHQGLCEQFQAGPEGLWSVRPRIHIFDEFHSLRFQKVSVTVGQRSRACRPESFVPDLRCLVTLHQEHWHHVPCRVGESWTGNLSVQHNGGADPVGQGHSPGTFLTREAPTFLPSQVLKKRSRPGTKGVC